MTELTFSSFDDAASVAKALLKNNYVVMLSMEEELYVLDCIWTDDCNRNDIVFMGRDEFEEEVEDD